MSALDRERNSLETLELPTFSDSIPNDVTQILAAGRAEVDQYVADHGNEDRSGFVPSNPELVYLALRAISEMHGANDMSFCEWGSGLGIATCLASQLGFDACGIEIEPDLVKVSRRFAKQFELPATFVQGSFVPMDGRSLSEEAFRDNEGRYPWLKCTTHDGYANLGRQLDSFDVIFAYPWPGEEYFTKELFCKLAGPRSLLLCYSDSDKVSLLQKRAFTPTLFRQ